MFSEMWVGASGGAEGFGFLSKWSASLSFPISLPFLCLSSLFRLLLPHTPSFFLLQGAILTTMLATRNFSGRWWGLKVLNTSCKMWGHYHFGYLDTLRPGGLGRMGAAEEAVTWGLAYLMQTYTQK